jgi:uncharacterized membrane protein (DUF106 family)
MERSKTEPKIRKRNKILGLILAILVIAVIIFTIRGVSNSNIDKEKMRHYEESTES